MVKTEDGVKLELEHDDAEVKHKMELRESSIKSEFSRVNTPQEGSSSSSSSPKPQQRKLKVKKASPPPFNPTFITDLPNADEVAKQSYIDLDRCLYESKSLGLSKQTEEMMVCDCVHEKGSDETLCGPHDECINRLTQVECLASVCRADEYCTNQRFAKQQYADIEVVQTEKKGFGLRARQNLENDTFIYEYIGEVVREDTFMKRMSRYADEGIKHFYFMMLQKEEYVDATKKGGIGRFANHSCNPNCYVAKWVVGKRMRMGIFTKRDVLAGEELTFNYNVDRYGHDAQICYCGEPNCVGTIGGTTQTEIGGIDDIFLDALGIRDDIEAMGKGNRKKKSFKLDEETMPDMRPIEKHESAKVVAAVRQSIENRPMALLVLQRIKMTEDSAVQSELMRMHGFSMMHTVLIDFAADEQVVAEILRCLLGWKLSFKNKIEDSQIASPVSTLAESSNEEVASLAKRVLEYWETLAQSYRIPRRKKILNLDADDEAATSTIQEIDIIPYSHRNDEDDWERIQAPTLRLAPVVYRQPAQRPKPPQPATPVRPSFAATQSSDRSRLDAIIALAAQSVQAAAVASTPDAGPSVNGTPRRERDDEDDEEAREHASRKRAKRSAEQKERKLMKMVGEVVVRSMSKYREQMEHETFKRYAKECTNALVEKEKKKPAFTESDRLESFSEEKKAKLKAFTKDYAHKVLKKLKAKGKLIAPLKNQRPSMSTPTTPAAGQAQSEDQLVTDMFGGDDVEDPSPPEVVTPEGSPPPYEGQWRQEKSVVSLAVTPGTPPDVEMEL